MLLLILRFCRYSTWLKMSSLNLKHSFCFTTVASIVFCDSIISIQKYTVLTDIKNESLTVEETLLLNSLILNNYVSYFYCIIN